MAHSVATALPQQPPFPNSSRAGRDAANLSHKPQQDPSPRTLPDISNLAIRPAKVPPMPDPNKTIAVVNASGRQAASFIRVATAVGYHVRAQLRNFEGVIASEVAQNPDVTVLQGELYTRQSGGSISPSHEEADLTREGPFAGIGINHTLITDLFRGATLAFINTTFYGDEVLIGQALADAAKEAGIVHTVYSSMPNHNAYNSDWPVLPLWASKHVVEDYIRSINLPATFLYTGIYNNNFTSLPYPLFCMEVQHDGSFLWKAPFHPDAKLPWLDAEHDVGPAILQLFKDVDKWRNQRIALAYEVLTPVEACRLFSKGVGRKVRYQRSGIELRVKIPEGYRVQLEALEKLFTIGGDVPSAQPPYFGDQTLEDSCPEEALALWEGYRGLEEYAREVFPVEEQANGLTWMLDDESMTENGTGGSSTRGRSTPAEGSSPWPPEEDDEDDEDKDRLVMRSSLRIMDERLA